MRPQRHFQDELDRLKSRLVTMASLAEESVKLAVEALVERDPKKAADVIRGDNAIDLLEIEIEEICVHLLATQQPMARDLRFITMALKIGSDLERVGDHSVNIAEETEYMINAGPFPPLPEIEEMVRITTDMLADALDAFIRGDSGLARDIGRRDDRVDELHDNVFRICLTHMMEDPRKITAGMDMFLVSGNLERIADLATNLAEDVVYLVEGRNIKHRSEERPPELVE